MQEIRSLINEKIASENLQDIEKNFLRNNLMKFFNVNIFKCV